MATGDQVVSLDGLKTVYNTETKMLAPTEASSTASASHTPGTSSEYFIYRGVLYQAKENIAQGETIVTSGSGANCKEAPLGKAVSELKSALDGAEVDITSDFVFSENRVINADDGAINNASGDTYKANQNFVNISGFKTLRITMPQWGASSATYRGLAFYSAADKNAYVSGIRFPQGESYAPIVMDIPIPEGAKYVRTTYWFDTTSFAASKIITGTNERVAALESKASDISDDVVELETAVDNLADTVDGGMVSAEQTTGWRLGHYKNSDGTYDAATKQICNANAVGIPTGTGKITCDDGYIFLLSAWDTNGNYIGTRKTGDVFNTETTGYLLNAEYNCSKHSEYVYRVNLQMSPTSESITTADGAHCHFISRTDSSLTMPQKAADAKAIGDKLQQLEDAIYGDETVDFTKQYPISANISPTQNKWTAGNSYSNYILQIPDGAVRATISANDSRETYYALLKTSDHTSGTTPDYVDGVIGRATINTGETLVIDLPSDAHYIWVSGTIQSVKREPASMIYRVNKSKEQGITIWGGRYLGACGHSFTQGTHLTDRHDAWPYVLAKRLRMSGVQNIAVGGSTIAKDEGSYEEMFLALKTLKLRKKTRQNCIA